MQSPLTELLQRLSTSQIKRGIQIMNAECLNRQQAIYFPPSQILLDKIYSTINSKYNQREPTFHKASFSFSENELTSQNLSSTRCNCKKSKCLKLYCECFAIGILCNGCGCICCHNKQQFSDIRAKAIDDVMFRGPLPFGHKNSSMKGCNCKKTGCSKKYCECFNSGNKCNQLCKCTNCQNCSGV